MSQTDLISEQPKIEEFFNAPHITPNDMQVIYTNHSEIGGTDFDFHLIFSRVQGTSGKTAETRNMATVIMAPGQAKAFAYNLVLYLIQHEQNQGLIRVANSKSSLTKMLESAFNKQELKKNEKQ